MNIQLNIPSEWLHTLSVLQGVYPSAIIAGGALRDIFFNKPVKDVDIFVELDRDTINTDTFLEEVANTLESVLEEDSDVKLIAASTYSGTDLDRDILCIFNIVVNSKTYDIIFIARGSVPAVEKFDVNICQIYYDGYKVITTSAFDDCVETKTIKVLNVNRKDRGRKRLERMQAKFPEFTIEWPEAYNEEIETTIIDFARRHRAEGLEPKGIAYEAILSAEKVLDAAEALDIEFAPDDNGSEPTGPEAAGTREVPTEDGTGKSSAP